MLEDLDRINWRTLRLEHQTAGEIPKLLRRLWRRNGEEGEIIQELEELLFVPSGLDSNTYACEAHPYVVPFLIELLEMLAPAEQAEILGLLGMLATSISSEAYRRSWPSHDPRKNTSASEARLAEEQEWALAARVAVVASASPYLRLLAKPDPAIRRMVCFLLAQCTAQRERIVPSLLQLLHQETDLRNTLPLIAAIGELLLGNSQPDAEAALETIHQDLKAAPQLRLAAALSLARIRGAEHSRDLVPTILELTPAHRHLYEMWAWEAHEPLNCVAQIFGEGSRAYLDLLRETVRSGDYAAQNDALYRIAALEAMRASKGLD